MAATPQFAVFNFLGRRSGKSYSVDAYVSDVNNAAVRFDEGSGASATSATDWIAPEDVILRDFSMVTGTADTEKLRITRGNTPTGDLLRYAIHLTTLAFRPFLNIGFRRGAKVSAIQISD